MSQTIFRDPKIGLCQLHIPQSSTPASQFQRAATLTRQAVNDGADIVVFPEMAVGFAPNAYATMDERANFSEACTRELGNFQALARELSVNLIPGSMSEAIFDADGQVLYHCNTTYYIDRTGTIRLRYAKANLWGDERKCFTKGSTHEVFDTQEFGKIGLLICWDLAFPEAFRALIKQDARIIFIPTLWKLPDCGEKGLRYNKRSEGMFINSTIAARAFEQNACVVFCNTGGPLDEGHFGCSQICMPFLGPIVKLGPEEQVVVKEVQFKSILEDAEDVWNIRADIMSPDWYQHS